MEKMGHGGNNNNLKKKTMTVAVTIEDNTFLSLLTVPLKKQNNKRGL